MNPHNQPLRLLTRRSAPLGTLIAAIGLTGLFGICRNNPYLATVFALLILFLVLFLALSLYRLHLNYGRRFRHFRRRVNLMRHESKLFRALMADNPPDDTQSR